MKVTLEVSPADQQLSDQDLLAKALRGAAQAVQRARPSVQPHVRVQRSDGAELRAIEELGERLGQGYAARMERMLEDVAGVLATPPSRKG